MTQAEYLDTWSLKQASKQLSWYDQVRLFLQRKETEQSLISGGDATKMADGIDISHWQGDVDISLMRSQGKISFCFPKASDGKQVQAGDPTYVPNYIDDWLYRNVQKCYDAKIACIPYHYLQLAIPDYTVEGLATWNFTVLKKALEPLIPKKSYYAICLDIEERNASDISGSDVAMKTINKIKADPVLSSVPLILYSSISVLNQYTGLREQISYPNAGCNLWMAQWSYNTTTTTTWEQFLSYYVPRIEMRVLTPGYASWQFLQWSSSFILPGNSGRTDVNKYKAGEAALYAWLGFQAAEPPPPDPDPDPEPDPNPDLTELTARVDALEVWRANIAGVSKTG